MAVDPFWENVVLRMTFDDTLADFSDGSHTLALVTRASPGTPALDPEYLTGKFGKGYRNGPLNNTPRRLESQGSPAGFSPGAGDFTLEYWLFGNLSTDRFNVSCDNTDTGTRSFAFGVSTRATSGVNLNKYSIEAFVYNAANAMIVNISGGLEFGPSGNGVGEWTHLCFERAGGNFRVYRNGAMIHKVSTLGTASVRPVTSPLRIGGRKAFSGDTTMSGGVHQIDDLRFTIGVARYASDAGFAVPTEPYPTSDGAAAVEVNPTAGSLLVSGSAPIIIAEQTVSPASGSLLVSGVAPAIVMTDVAFPEPCDLVIEGQAPLVFTGIVIRPPTGALVVQPGAPEVLIFDTAASVVSQQATLAIVVPPPAPAAVSQQAVLGVGYVIPPMAVSQQATLVVAHGGPCVTARCQIWTITRRDGVEFRYTSHDVDVRFGGKVYKACHSLNPSASENASTLGSVGNIELTGLIDDDGISEADLYGGKFDDAFVTVDLISWGAPADVPRRLASGWTGQLSQGDTSFNMEVLGSTARLEQQALTQPFAPACRWIFGDARCGVDVEAMAIQGAVTQAISRSRFVASLSDGPSVWQWENGRLRFTSGVNNGQVLEVKTVDFDTGLVTLWPSASLLPGDGDTFDLLPGCDKAKTGGCTIYANVINHGGFSDVPGQDAMLDTPNAKY